MVWLVLATCVDTGNWWLVGQNNLQSLNFYQISSHLLFPFHVIRLGCQSCAKLFIILQDKTWQTAGGSLKNWKNLQTVKFLRHLQTFLRPLVLATRTSPFSVQTKIEIKQVHITWNTSHVLKAAWEDEILINNIFAIVDGDLYFLCDTPHSRYFWLRQQP